MEASTDRLNDHLAVLIHLHAQISVTVPIEDPNSTTATASSSSSIATPMGGSLGPFGRAFEPTLYRSRPYRHITNESIISLTSSQRLRPSWSLISGNSNDSVYSLPITSFTLSGRSLKETPDLSTIPLPLVLDRVYSGRWYGSGPVSPHVGRNLHQLLMMAVRDEEWESVGALLARVTEVGDRTGTILPDAIYKEAPADIIELFLNRGAHPGAPDRDNNTALHYASRLGDANFVQTLLAHGASPNDNNDGHQTPLHWAVIADKADIVRLLLRNGADIESQDDHFRRPLHWASIQSHEETVSVLLQSGADVKAPGWAGWTILRETISQGSSCYRTAALLLAAGADPNSHDRPIYRAVETGLANIVQLLLDHGADIPTAERDQPLPLLHMACINDHTLVMEVLLNAGSDVNGSSYNGNTPLHYWVTPPDSSMICSPPRTKLGTDTLRMLLKHGASLEVRNNHGHTAFDLATGPQRAVIERELQEISSAADASALTGSTIM